MITRLDLISPAYVAENQRLHAMPSGFGGKGRKWAETVRWLLRHLDAWSVLDYGCGQGSLALALTNPPIPGVRVSEYDPAIPGKDHLPVFADLVVCTDVLEHVEADRLDTVLAHLKTLARKAILLVVNLGEANKVLSDGRNAHLIIESQEWWRAKIAGAGLSEVELPGMPSIKAYLQPEKRQKAVVMVCKP